MIKKRRIKFQNANKYILQIKINHYQLFYGSFFLFIMTNIWWLSSQCLSSAFPPNKHTQWLGLLPYISSSSSLVIHLHHLSTITKKVHFLLLNHVIFAFQGKRQDRVTLTPLMRSQVNQQKATYDCHSTMGDKDLLQSNVCAPSVNYKNFHHLQVWEITKVLNIHIISQDVSHRLQGWSLVGWLSAHSLASYTALSFTLRSHW